MLSEKSIEIVGCTQEPDGYWKSCGDGPADQITEAHIIGVLVTWLLGNGCYVRNAWVGDPMYVVESNESNGQSYISKGENLLDVLNEAVNERGES